MKKYTTILSRFAPVLAVSILLVPFVASAYQAAPVANTSNATFITEKGAQMNGTVNANEMPDTYAWFEWGIAGRSSVYETNHRQVNGGSRVLSFTDTLYGLAPNVQYFYRQVAENSRGRDVGMTSYFTTKPLKQSIDPAVIVQTQAPTTVLEHSAVLRGYIAPHESTDVHWWFEWGTTDKLENTTPTNSWGADSGVAQVNVTNLTSGTQYYYRIVAENSLGVVYSNTIGFTTPGLPPPPPEAPRSQNIPSPQSGDGVSRNVTTAQGSYAAGQAGNTSVGSGSNGSFPGVSYLPGNIFGSLFGTGKPATSGATNSATGNTASAQAGSANTATQNANIAASQTASAGAATPLGTFWNTLTGKKDTMVSVEKVGPASAPAHTPVEYRVTYAYHLSSVASNAKLKIILPGSIVYIGDNTTNELMLEQGAGPERTYVLPIGRLENGSTRTISILGMTTGDAGGTFPDARARLEYTNSSGAVEVVSAEGATQTQSAAVSQSNNNSSPSFSIFPSTFFGWLVYIGLITLLIFVIRKARGFYQKRKEQIALEEEAARRDREGSQMNGAVAA